MSIERAPDAIFIKYGKLHIGLFGKLALIAASTVLLAYILVPLWRAW
jgi:hypothetical protein